jgi:hypothetical protein
MRVKNVWKLPHGDKASLAGLLGVEAESIYVIATLATAEPPICPNCGRQVGLLDIAKTALDMSAHGGPFLVDFFQGNPREKLREEILHRVNCFKCDARQPTVAGWAANFGWTYDDKPDPDQQGVGSGYVFMPRSA